MKTTIGAITATLAANGVTHTLNPSGPDQVGVIGVSGTFTSPTWVIEGHIIGGSVWYPLSIINRNSLLRSSGSEASGTSTTASWFVDLRGCDQVRVYLSAGAGITAVIEIATGTPAEVGSGPVSINNVSTGSNTFGVVSATSVVATSPTGAGVGYATGAGGAVTQTTNRSTGVTLSKLTGQITTDTTSLAAGAEAEFTVTNTTVAATDTVVVSLASGNTGVGTCIPVISAVAAGSFKILITNQHASTAETGACVLNFAVIKGVAA